MSKYIKTNVSFMFEVHKREFSLITKALCGKLRPEEIEEAKLLGYNILKEYEDDLVRKLDASEHALEMSQKMSENKNPSEPTSFLSVEEDLNSPRVMGALPPSDANWQIDATAASLLFVKDAETVIQYLQQKVDRIKNHQEELDDFLNVKDFMYPSPSPFISFEDFSKVKLKVGTVLECERVPKTDKLLKLTVDLGEENVRTIVAGVGGQYIPEQIIGQQLVVVSNLAPRKLRGIESHGMLLAASCEGMLALIQPSSHSLPGSEVG